MYYQNQFGYRSKARGTFLQRLLQRLSKQLMAVFILMLILLLLKYTTNGRTSFIVEKGKNIFYLDYTSQATEVFKTYSPDIGEFFYGLFNKVVQQNEY
jgi:hypothetical protein